MHNESKKSILAVDVGYGNTKAVWNLKRTPSKADSWAEICFRSVTPPVVVAGINPSIASLDRVIVNVGPNAYFVGPQATFEGGSRALHPDYISKEEHEALLRGAWHYMFKSMGQVTQSVDMLVVGLPVSGFQANRRRLHQIGSAVRQVPVPEELRSHYGKDFVDVVAKKVLVLPQPMGGLRLASDHERSFDLFEDGMVSMLVDVGYNTLDWFIADAMSPQFELCGSFSGGFSQILQAVSNQIGFDTGSGSPNFGLVEKALLSGEMRIGQKTLSMQSYLPMVAKVAERNISEFLQRFDPDRIGVSKVYLCGGGADAYQAALSVRLPNYAIELMDDSVMANARGYYLAGQDYLDD
jgi:plasmid segregation protein ParM